MLAPGLNPVAMIGDCLSSTVDAGFRLNKVERNLLGTTATVHIVQVLEIKL